MPSECFDAISNESTHWKHAKGMSLRNSVVVLGYSTHPHVFYCIYTNCKDNKISNFIK